MQYTNVGVVPVGTVVQEGVLLPGSKLVLGVLSLCTGALLVQFRKSTDADWCTVPLQKDSKKNILVLRETGVYKAKALGAVYFRVLCTSEITGATVLNIKEE